MTSISSADTLSLSQTAPLESKPAAADAPETAVANLQTYTMHGIAIAKPIGRFDAYAVEAIRDWLDKAMAASPAQIIVNLNKVNFIDSTAIASLMRGLKYCQQNDGDLYLCSLQQPVQIIAELMRLDTVFSIFDSEAGAIDAFTK